MATCPRCGEPNRDGARFCDACGAILEPEGGTASRRVVTVLFSDITGSTALGERLDPERMRQVLARYFDAMRSVVERHGGTVEKFIGDAVMAVFGIPRIHEDDALRAVRAAAEIGGALEAINDELAAAHGVRIRTRTGVNTGEVMVDASATGQGSVTGDVVNVAARFEQRAEPGEVLIGEDTYRLVRDAVLADPLEAMDLKGKADPVPAYRLLKVDPQAAGFARRLDAPMVGRERELSLLRGAFDRAVSDHACQLFTVLGVGGVGKSRLMRAFVGELDDRATVLEGRCLPYGDGITFWPIVEAVGRAAGLSDVDDAESSVARIAALIPGNEHAERVSRQVAQVMGVSDEQVVPEETLWAIRRLLEGMAEARPVTLVIDDIQWAEPTMLELIEYIASWSVDSPLLLACMARPELLEARPGWGGGNLNATSIALEPLSIDECGSLVANLLAIERVDPDVQRRIATAAEGHPLFAEELLAMLVDDGRIVRTADGWVAVGELSELEVPPTTSALLAARIDRLSSGERITLQRASVIGQVFYRDAIEPLDGGGDALGSLVRKQFIRPERSDLAGVDAFVFRHLLIRDAAYDGLTKEERATLHEGFAQWLTDRAPEQEELIGHHLEQAFRYLGELGADAERSAQIGELAAIHLSAAGTRALERSDIPATVNLLSRALALMSDDAPDRVATSIDLGNALSEQGDLEAASSLLDDAVKVAAAGGDPVVTARAKVARLQLRMWGHNDVITIAAAFEEARGSLALFEDAGDALGIAWASTLLGHFEWSRCRAEATRGYWGRAVELFRVAGDRHRADEYLGWSASIPVWGPTPCADALVELDTLIAQARGSRVVESDIEDSRASVLWMVGDFEGARAASDGAHRLRLELGRRVADAHASQTPGWIELLAGDATAAERILREGAETLATVGSDASFLLSAMHARALYDLGRYDEAETAALHGPNVNAADVAGDYLALGVRAMVAARRGALDEAERLAREAVAMIDEGDFMNDQGDARMMLAEVLELAGRLVEAGTVVSEALHRYRAKGNLTQTAMAEARLLELAG